MVCLRGGPGPRQRPGVLAAALLKLAILPACLAVAAAQPARSRPGSLDARVAQFGGSRPP